MTKEEFVLRWMIANCREELERTQKAHGSAFRFSSFYENEVCRATNVYDSTRQALEKQERAAEKLEQYIKKYEGSS